MENLPNQPSYSSATGRVTPCLIVVGVVIASVLMQSNPVALDTLQWHREAGLFTRSFDWMTGHLAHWSWNHLLWDLAAFLMLSLVVIRIRPERFTLCVFAAAIAIPLEIALNQAQIDTYRGLSGIDSAIFGLIVATLWQSAGNQASNIPWNRILSVIAGILFAAKFGFELVTGGTFFVASAVGDQFFLPVPSAHLIGAIVGFFVGFIHGETVKGNQQFISRARNEHDTNRLFTFGTDIAMVRGRESLIGDKNLNGIHSHSTDQAPQPNGEDRTGYAG